MSSQLELIDIVIRNFLSIGSVAQAVKLNSNSLTLIMGKNYDSGGRNGCGKSGLLNAICFALYGESIMEVKYDNLVNNINKKNMLVVLNFKKDGIPYKIERGRKPNIFKFYINGSDKDMSKGEKKYTQEDVLEIIGMSHMMFTHLIGMNTYTEPFLKMKAAPQRELIEELLGISLLSKRDETVKKLISDTKKSIEIEQAVIKATIDANTRIEQAIQRSKNDMVTWENSRNFRLINYQNALEKIENIDFEKELSIFDEIVGVENTKKQIIYETNLNKIKISSKREELEKIYNEQVKSNSFDIEPHILRLQKDLENQERILNSDNDSYVKMLNQSIISLNLDIEHFTKIILKTSEEISHLEEHLLSDEHFCNACGQKFNDENHLQEAKEKIREKISDYSKQIDRLFQNIDNLKNEIQSKLDAILESNELINKNKENAQRRIEEISKEINDLFTNKELLEIKLQESIALLEYETLKIENELLELQEDDKQLKRLLSGIVIPKSTYKNKEEVWAIRDQKEQLLRDIEAELEKENPHEKNIENLLSTMQAISYDYINELRDDLAHQEFIHKLLSGKDSFIRKKIIEQNLPYLNMRINYYLDLLSLPHEIKILSDLSVEVIYMGNDYEFGQLSRGQQGRVILATAWAFRDVWENLNNFSNLMFVDELLDSGIDDEGAEAGLAIMNKMAREQKRNIFLISHKEVFIGRVDHTLIVHYENRFSRFEEDGQP
jgi:DNA repair exonuclease SbcCD ATPase subunit